MTGFAGSGAPSLVYAMRSRTVTVSQPRARSASRSRASTSGETTYFPCRAPSFRML